MQRDCYLIVHGETVSTKSSSLYQTRHSLRVKDGMKIITYAKKGESLTSYFNLNALSLHKKFAHLPLKDRLEKIKQRHQQPIFHDEGMSIDKRCSIKVHRPGSWIRNHICTGPYTEVDTREEAIAKSLFGKDILNFNRLIEYHKIKPAFDDSNEPYILLTQVMEKFSNVNLHILSCRSYADEDSGCVESRDLRLVYSIEELLVCLEDNELISYLIKKKCYVKIFRLIKKIKHYGVHSELSLKQFSKYTKGNFYFHHYKLFILVNNLFKLTRELIHCNNLAPLKLMVDSCQQILNIVAPTIIQDKKLINQYTLKGYRGYCPITHVLY